MGMGHGLGDLDNMAVISHVNTDAQEVVVGEGEDGESEGEMV